MRESVKICAQCGNPFARNPQNTWAYWERAKYCGKACFGMARSANAAAARKPLSEKFNEWVIRSDGCWGWGAAKDRDGYGIFCYAGKSYRAPKVALELDGRPVPKGEYACHTCDNPGCVRPSHLYPGTPTQNMADAISRNRLRPAAKLSKEDVISIRTTTEPTRALAKRFNVSTSNVSMVRRRKTWRGVE